MRKTRLKHPQHITEPASGMGNPGPEVGSVHSSAQLEALMSALEAMRRAGYMMARQAEEALKALGVSIE